jgi:hypothetical protein
MNCENGFPLFFIKIEDQNNLVRNVVSAIYNDRSGKHYLISSGENSMPQANQTAEQKQKLWAINPRKPTRRNPARKMRRPAAPTRRKTPRSPPSPPLARKSNRRYWLPLLVQKSEEADIHFQS